MIISALQVAADIRNFHLPNTDAQKQRIARGYGLWTKKAAHFECMQQTFEAWAVQSQYNVGTIYTVRIFHRGKYSSHTCECQDFRNHGTAHNGIPTGHACKHIAAVLIERDWVRQRMEIDARHLAHWEANSVPGMEGAMQ